MYKEGRHEDGITRLCHDGRPIRDRALHFEDARFALVRIQPGPMTAWRHVHREVFRPDIGERDPYRHGVEAALLSRPVLVRAETVIAAWDAQLVGHDVHHRLRLERRERDA